MFLRSTSLCLQGAAAGISQLPTLGIFVSSWTPHRCPNHVQLGLFYRSMAAYKPLCIPAAARWNEYIAVPLAFGVNLFLAFVISTRSPKSLKIYNRVMLTNCVCDLMLSTACLIVGFVSADAVRWILTPV